MHSFLEKFFLISHVVSGAWWTGGVFMASMVDWPAMKGSSDGKVFPFNFIVAQGSRIVPYVYSAMVVLLLSGFGLLWLHPPHGTLGWSLAAVKILALAWMGGSTIYGTLVSWPKLQFALHEEAFVMYNRYIQRAYITFGCGILGLVAGVILSRSAEWFP
jgi:hypothetical protein